jgi:1-aminocyclopropane-1-carboxylate deaminase
MLHPALIALEKSFSQSPVQQIQDEYLQRAGVELWIKRDDLLHPVISGNKWRKLKYCLNHALNCQKQVLVSMGGPWSNHLHALAYAGKVLGLKTRAFIRGERPRQFSPTLLDIQRWGMQLEFVSRQQYRLLRQYRSFDSLPGLKAEEYWLPEGGASHLALQGVQEIITEITIQYSDLFVSCGTGTTLAGLIAASSEEVQVCGIAALKGAGFLTDEVKKLLPKDCNTPWRILLDYHCGGFARITPELQQFIEQFEARHSIALDRVYNGKMFYAIYQLIQQGAFKPGQRIVAVHSGGLQGNRHLSS